MEAKEYMAKARVEQPVVYIYGVQFWLMHASGLYVLMY